jgi:hypothetical protein
LFGLHKNTKGGILGVATFYYLAYFFVAKLVTLILELDEIRLLGGCEWQSHWVEIWREPDRKLTPSGPKKG